MRKITLITLMLFTALSYAQVGINTNTPNASSALEIESTTGGILIPRMTETQRDAIVSPVAGLMIYQTDEISGFYFYNGTAWAKIDGVVGPQGDVGPAGAQGNQGPAGAPGADGADGADGAQGPIGPTGNQGAQGPVGADSTVPGPIGPIGPAGPQGNQGAPGPAGADSTVPGPVGQVGPVGPTGPMGPAGNQGAQGPVGADSTVPGPVGQVGPVGQAGPIGPAGAQGNQGAQGLAGPIGPTGNQGAQGPVGPAGPTGAQGPAGADSTVPGPVGQVGPTGAQGPIGPAGADADTSEIAALSDIINNDQAAPSLTIGDYIGGGIVFWVDPNDATQGLVCAVDNQSTGIQWYNGVYTVTGASGTAIGTGAANTTAIISAQGLTEVNYAAGLARAHNGGGFTDWFLPSKDALHHIYTNRVTINTKAVENGGAASFTNGYYWTSTQSGSNVAAYQHFANGSQYYIDTNASFYVRAVRAVSSLATSSLSTITSEQIAQNTAIDLKANISSPTFTGTVTTPTLIASGNTYPNTTGNANQVLTTDGSGTLSWTTSSAETINGTVNEIEVSTSDSTTTVGLPDNTTITTSLTVDGLYFGTGSGDGDNNLAIGSSMGSGTGKRNTAIGSRALESYSGTGFDNNTAVGYYNMRALTTGFGNTAIGAENMFSLTTGNSNTSIGNQTMLNVSTGNNNTGLGKRAGESITTGTNNTLIGLDANVSSPNANNETVIGKGAIGSGDNTVQLGNTSVTNVKTSGSITAGAITIPNTDGTSGQVLTTDGSGALSWTTSSAGVSGSGTANMIAKFDGSSTVLGNSSIYDDGTNVGIGTVSPAQLLHVKAASGDAKALINAYGEGDEAHLMLRTGGINKTAIVASGISNWGRTDLRFILNSYTNANDYGLSDTKMIIKNDGKVGIGTNSPTEKLDVAGNIKFNGALMPNNNAGSSGQVLTSSGTGVPTWTTISGGASSIDELSDAIHSNQYNTLIIGTTPSISQGASYSTGVGKRVLEKITTGDENVAMGHQALGETTSGSLNTAMGSHVIFRNTIGSQNSAFGKRVLENNTTGSNNTGIGASAGDTNTTGTNNTLIGYNADLSSNNFTNATAIGSNATVNASNKIKLGNSNVTNVETAGSITAGAITIPNTDGTSGQVLTTDGSGALSWTTSSAGVSGSGTANMIAKFDGSSTVLGNSSIYDDGTNVGIGTVSPAQLLHVKAASGDAKALINAYGEGDEAHLMLRTGGINKTAIVASGISNWGRTDLRFILNSYTNANDYGLSDTKMIIKNDGKVGIGTNSPTEKLDVAGNIKFNGALMPNNNAGSSGQVLTSSGTGVPTWTTPSSGSDSVYSVNTFYAELGGFVIEIRDGGKHGLVVAMQDQGVSTWYPIDNLLNDITRHDTNGAKFMDWRLPTIRELELIYLAKANISPMWSGNDYWSSTQPGYGNAYFVNMANGFGTSSNSPGANHNTNNSKAVRAVRAF